MSARDARPAPGEDRRSPERPWQQRAGERTDERGATKASSEAQASSDACRTPAFLGLCPLANATPIAVPTTSPTPIVVGFTLSRVDAVFANGFD